LWAISSKLPQEEKQREQFKAEFLAMEKQESQVQLKQEHSKQKYSNNKQQKGAGKKTQRRT
jgi:hypothetical protein